jgi:hypothetical protein
MAVDGRRARRPRAAAASFTALLLALCVAPTSAQTVRGRVVDQGSAAPLPGAIVSLLDQGGARVRSVLTNGTGAFLMSGAPAGRYLLRVEMIGRRSVESDPFVVTPGVDPAALTIELPAQPITLAGIDVSTAQRCAPGREAARETYTVWQEAEKALRAAALTSRQPLYRFRILAYERLLDPRSGNVLREATQEEVQASSDPFNSLPPAEIARSGYVRQEGNEVSIWGPNTDLLLSGEFQTTHCFALRREQGRPGLIGLTFEPVEGRDLPDIEGVLWVDAASAELRTLEFEYRNLPSTLVRGEYTGFAEFHRLEEGTWIIRRWRLRSPPREQGAEVRAIERVSGPAGYR